MSINFNDIFLFIIGIFFGSSIAGALFALITSIGIITRLADRTHTKRGIFIYETALLLGGTLGNICIVYHVHLSEFLKNVFSTNTFSILTSIIICTIGLFFGIYVGCLVMSLAEVLKVSVVFSRRLRLHDGLWISFVFLAVGKCIGSILYFFKDCF